MVQASPAVLKQACAFSRRVKACSACLCFAHRSPLLWDALPLSLDFLLLVPLSSVASPFGVLQTCGVSSLPTGVVEGTPSLPLCPRPGPGSRRIISPQTGRLRQSGGPSCFGVFFGFIHVQACIPNSRGSHSPQTDPQW